MNEPQIQVPVHYLQKLKHLFKGTESSMKTICGSTTSL